MTASSDWAQVLACIDGCAHDTGKPSSAQATLEAMLRTGLSLRRLNVDGLRDPVWDLPLVPYLFDRYEAMQMSRLAQVALDSSWQHACNQPVADALAPVLSCALALGASPDCGPNFYAFDRLAKQIAYGHDADAARIRDLLGAMDALFDAGASITDASGLVSPALRLVSELVRAQDLRTGLQADCEPDAQAAPGPTRAALLEQAASRLLERHDDGQIAAVMLATIDRAAASADARLNLRAHGQAQILPRAQRVVLWLVRWLLDHDRVACAQAGIGHATECCPGHVFVHTMAAWLAAHELRAQARAGMRAAGAPHASHRQACVDGARHDAGVV